VDARCALLTARNPTQAAANALATAAAATRAAADGAAEAAAREKWPGPARGWVYDFVASYF
jgi:hypothetical protein